MSLSKNTRMNRKSFIMNDCEGIKLSLLNSKSESVNKPQLNMNNKEGIRIFKDDDEGYSIYSQLKKIAYAPSTNNKGNFKQNNFSKINNGLSIINNSDNILTIDLRNINESPDQYEQINSNSKYINSSSNSKNTKIRYTFDPNNKENINPNPYTNSNQNSNFAYKP